MEAALLPLLLVLLLRGQHYYEDNDDKAPMVVDNYTQPKQQQPNERITLRQKQKVHYIQSIVTLACRFPISI